MAQDGRSENISVVVSATPVTSRVAKGVLNMAGVTTNAEELSYVRKEQGMMGVTGFVVKGIGTNSKFLVIPMFIFVLMILLLITTNLVLRRHAGKHSI